MPLPFTGEKCLNLISDMSYDVTNDIVMSIHYSLSGNSISEAGLSFFICASAADQELTSAQNDTGLGYIDLPHSIAAFGVDTDGNFAQTYVPNTLAARSGINENFALSSFGDYIIDNVIIVNPDDAMRTLRYRIGNLGRTMYLDYRVNHDDEFTSIAQVDIGDRLTLGEPYRIGMGFSTPFSTTEEAKVNIRIESIHIEGLEYVPD